MKLNETAGKILTERFSRDSVIALATVGGGLPQVRYVNAFYDDGAFYAITHALSNKMKQIGEDDRVAVAGEWFTAHGRGVSLGYFGSPENRAIAGKLKDAFREWLGNGHTDLEDKNTVILCVRLTDGVLFSRGVRYDIEFE